MKVTPVSYAVVSDMYWVPLDEVPAHRVRKRFTVTAKLLDHKSGDEVEQPIPVYREDAKRRPGLIGVPIAVGEHLFPAEDLQEDLTKGMPFNQWTRLPDPSHPLAAPGQDRFMAQMRESVEDQYTTLAKAETGTGKTVVSLGLAAELGRSTIVLVPTEQLMKQWIQQAQDILGLSREYIGIVQGERCQYKKPFVVAMMKSLTLRRYPDPFYRAFGTAIVDELHNTGATTISRTQGLFTAENKWGQTATDKRRDGADRVYYDYYGDPSVRTKMKGVNTRVLLMPYRGKVLRVTDRVQRLQALSKDHDRNLLLTRIAGKWYEEGHDILLVSDFVDHCHLLRRYLVAYGIPEDQVGMFAAQQVDSKGSRVKTPQDYLDWCREHPAVIVATYKMLKEGIDIPRLSRGADCLPKSEMEQVLGRIRRKHPGKDWAEWVSLIDWSNPAVKGLQHPRMQSISHINSVHIHRVTEDEFFRR